MKIGIKKFFELMDEQGLGKKEHDGVKMCMKCYNAIYSESDNHKKIKAGVKKYGFEPCTCREIEICEFYASPEIDVNLFEIIREFNLKGYKTVCCCEGHDEVGYPYLNIWITFDHDYFGDMGIKIPDDFEYKEMNRKEFRTIDYADDYKHYIKMYPNTEYRDNIKEHKLKVLSDFVKSIPEYKKTY